MRLALLAFAAASSCNGGHPAPNPVPTIPPVVIGPVHQEAGTECALACERRKSEGCPSGRAPASLDHCIANCTDSRQQISNQTADDFALTFTCGERPSR